MASSDEAKSPFDPDDQSDLSALNDQPYAEEDAPPETDAPRRAASARFIVEGSVGSEAAIREAMDPANQSLADALRLSYRVLQAVIVVLIVLFLVSGLQTVDEGQTGVRTVWGKIQKDGASEALEPGLKFSLYPYPIAEFVLFPDDNRAVEMNREFAPAPKANAVTRQQAMESADVTTPLRPGYPGEFGDGSVLTRDGDLAHLEMSARFGINQAGTFVKRINDNDAKRNAEQVVKLALRRAAIAVAAESSLQELIDQPDDVRLRVQTRAQDLLDELECGIELTQVQVQRAYAPLAIEKALGDLQAARVEAAESIEVARKRANERLNDMAGQDYSALITLIEQYEDAREANDDAKSEELLAAIKVRISSTPHGEVSQIVQNARAYKDQLESTLGNEYRRFASELPAYRENPRLLLKQRWLDAYSKVISRPDAEMIYVDPTMSIRMMITGSSVIQELRRKAQISRGERQASREYDPSRPYQLRAGDINYDKEGRLLDIRNNKPAAFGTR